MSRQDAALRLFNSVIVPTTLSEDPRSYHEQTIPLGFIFTPRAAAVATPALIKRISALVGLSGEKANASFHKSWRVVAETPEFELRMQQLVHYITTYGFESLGIYSEQTIYIPTEVLAIPSLKDGLKLVVIDGITDDELIQRAVKLASGMALKEQTVADLFTILSEYEWNNGWTVVYGIGNRELRSKLYDHFGLVPQDPVEYLRFVIQKLTGETLLIKNRDLISKIADIKADKRAELTSLISKAPSDLASIFLRFKPIFLALKKVSSDRAFFNYLRKQAVHMHKPMASDYLNNVTAIIKKNGTYKRDLTSALRNASIFRKIRLAYALKYRTLDDANSIVYRVRNGKGYATSFSFNSRTEALDALDRVLASIATDLSHLSEKIVYIPEWVAYTLPATEKAYTGNLPTGTYVEVPEDMIVGIHWFDNDHQRVDLDLSTMSATGKVGWDGNYRTAGADVLFSGDLTAAPKPHGASELFYIKNGSADPKLMFVNYYNYSPSRPVEAKIVVANDKPVKGFNTSRYADRQYMIDPNKMLAVAPITVTKRQTTLGLIVNVDGFLRFYFAQTSVGDLISVHDSDAITQTREYFTKSMLNGISLTEMLIRAGANVVTERPTEGEYIDLAPESLTRDTFQNLFQNK